MVATFVTTYKRYTLTWTSKRKGEDKEKEKGNKKRRTNQQGKKPKKIIRGT